MCRGAPASGMSGVLGAAFVGLESDSCASSGNALSAEADSRISRRDCRSACRMGSGMRCLQHAMTMLSAVSSDSLCPARPCSVKPTPLCCDRLTSTVRNASTVCCCHRANYEDTVHSKQQTPQKAAVAHPQRCTQACECLPGLLLRRQAARRRAGSQGLRTPQVRCRGRGAQSSATGCH